MSRKSKKNQTIKSEVQQQSEKLSQPNIPPKSSHEIEKEIKSREVTANQTQNNTKTEVISSEKKASQEKELINTPSQTKVTPTLKVNDIKIFQIYFEPWQKDLLDPLFAAIDNSKFPSELRELDVFSRLAQSEYVKDARLWGALSWRFAEKTGMTGQDLMKEISANPDRDIYFCNPEPEYEALYHNLWSQGVPSHPQFLEVCQAFFKAVGLPLDTLISIEPIQSTSSANFFIGSSRFWSLYLPWIQNLLNTANKKMPPQMRDLLHSNVADDQKIHNGATYVPFIVERLFPLFLKTVGSSLKAHKINLVEPLKKLDVHLRLLREMKDVAHRTNSPWLAACWVNYRNLYLTQTKGASWCKNYLRQVTPEKIIF